MAQKARKRREGIERQLGTAKQRVNALGDAPFHVAVAVSPVLAYAWLRVAGRHVDRLQKGGISKWKVRKSAGR